MVTGDTAVGVPDIIPVDGSNDKPAGNDGPATKMVSAPPVLVGIQDAMVVPTMKTLVDGE